MARTLDEIGKKCPAEEEQKWSHEKPKLDKMPENYEEIISLTLRTRNSRRPSRMSQQNENASASRYAWQDKQEQSACGDKW